MTTRAAIVGAEVLTAFGDLAATCEGARRPNASALRRIDRFGATVFGDPLAGLLSDEDPGLEDDPAERVLGAHGRILATCARAAHTLARGAEIPREEVGLYVATGMIDASLQDLAPAVLASRGPDGRYDVARFLATGFRSIHPLWPLAQLNNVAVGQVAIDLDVRGDNLVLGCEADAGVRAFQEALAALEAGDVRMALVAGIAERIGPSSLARRRLRGVTTPPGEGGAVVILERPDSATARGIDPWAFLSGAALTFGRGAALRAERLASEEAGSGAPALPLEVLADRIGDLGPAGPGVEVACCAAAFRAGATPGGRALVRGRASTGAEGALVLESASVAVAAGTS